MTAGRVSRVHSGRSRSETLALRGVVARHAAEATPPHATPHGASAGSGARVVAVLADHDDAVDGELAAAAAEALVDGRVDGDAMRLRELQADVTGVAFPLRALVDVPGTLSIKTWAPINSMAVRRPPA